MALKLIEREPGKDGRRSPSDEYSVRSMITIPINQAVDVYWRLPSAPEPDEHANAREHVRKFDGLIAAARFAAQKAAEGNLSIHLYLAVGPALTAAQAGNILELMAANKIDGDVISLDQLDAVHEK